VSNANTSLTIPILQALVAAQQVVVSDHAYDKMLDRAIVPNDVLSGIAAAVVLEDYPDAHKGPSLLALQWDAQGLPIHVVWGVPAGSWSPAVLVTAYRPEPDQWGQDFRSRT
jgi:Domain of unknown function (DUF4258)